MYRHRGLTSLRLMNRIAPVAGLPPPTIMTLPGSYMTDVPSYWWRSPKFVDPTVVQRPVPLVSRYRVVPRGPELKTLPVGARCIHG